MDTIKFKSKEDFAKFVEEKAMQIIKEEKTQSLGNPNDLKLNKMDGSKNSTGAKVEIKSNGTFKTKTSAPTKLPKQFDTIEDAIDVKMEERDGGHDEDIATAAKIEGSKSTKGTSETNPYIEGQAKPKVDSKNAQPNVSVEADPTKEGGVPGKKNNDVEMNKEDKEDKTVKPMTQVLGKGEMSKDGYSKGQTDKEVNKEAQNEKDAYEQKLRDSIKTIQLPESFKNKKEMLEFIKKEAVRLVNTI
jgi:hypothetical protein